MLTNNETKLINSLVKKKFRQKYNKFIVEGVKNIQEVINSEILVSKIFTTEDIFHAPKTEISIISERELQKISQLVQPNTALALCEIPQPKTIVKSGFIIGLDDIRDPGNLGTIIRMADWFGIAQIICSKETVDVYNPKVIQSTMGSFTRVQLHYIDLEEFFQNYSHPILGTFMEGENIYQIDFPKDALLLMGNEANGISEDLMQFVSHKISIPRLGKTQMTESLNVAMATSIILGQRASQMF
ncbi:TrmH family RNA methyltransferase [Moheibacter stercoris]|uniref:TrmH family RNA methyltransferase n=1 Tax=Moheibacter stercoris TaxID=1628251 RepID=A0ABV2LSN3_9FLAO